MAVRKIRNSWWIDIRIDHVRYRKRSPENSKAGAEAYEALMRQKLVRGEINKPSDSLLKKQTFEQFAWKWFNQYVIANNKPSEQYAKQKTLSTQLIPFFGKIHLDAINTSHIEQFKARQVAQEITNKTINNRLTVLGKCLRCANEWYDTPVPRIKLLRCSPPKTDYLTVNECELLLSHAKDQVYEMVFLALRTGMRQGEIRGLQWTSIDWQNRSIVVRHSYCDHSKSLVSPKSNRERHIPIDADLYSLLFRRKQASGHVFLNKIEKTITGESITFYLHQLCKKAEVRKIGWHILRHTFATQLTLRGVPITIVKELLGHSTITTTMRYSHVAPSALRSAIALLSPKNAGMADFGQPVGNTWQYSTESEVKIPSK